MAFEIYGLDISLPTATDLSASQYCAVTVNGSGDAVLTAANGQAVGVLQNDPASGQTASVRVSGVTYAIANAAITPGQLLTVDASGHVGPGATGNYVIGVALDAAAAAGDYVSLLLKSVGTHA